MWPQGWLSLGNQHARISGAPLISLRWSLVTLLSLSAVKRTWCVFFPLSESGAAHLAYSNPAAAPAAFNHWNYQIKWSGNGLHKSTAFEKGLRLFLRCSCVRWRSERDKNISIVMPLQNMPHAVRKMWITEVIRIRLRKTAKEKTRQGLVVTPLLLLIEWVFWNSIQDVPLIYY